MQAKNIEKNRIKLKIKPKQEKKKPFKEKSHPQDYSMDVFSVVKFKAGFKQISSLFWSKFWCSCEFYLKQASNKKRRYNIILLQLKENKE